MIKTDRSRDAYYVRAAIYFDKPIEDITKVERQYVKEMQLIETYGGNRARVLLDDIGQSLVYLSTPVLVSLIDNAIAQSTPYERDVYDAALDELESRYDRLVEDPPSRDIADILSATFATHCPHEETVCYFQCGVRHTFLTERVGPGTWVPLSPHERQLWLDQHHRSPAP